MFYFRVVRKQQIGKIPKHVRWDKKWNERVEVDSSP